MLLDPTAARPYLDQAAKLLRATRLNHQWPDARRAATHLIALADPVHPEPVKISAHGLPVHAHWQRVASDATIAADGLSRMGARAALVQRVERRGLAIDRLQLARFDYYTALVRAPVLDLDAVDVRVRRTAGDTAWLRLVLDKLMADGRCVRVTVDVAQRGAGLVRLDADLAEPTAGLRGLVFRSASLTADLIWVALADQPAFEVERVVKGTLGPLRTPAVGWHPDWAEWPDGGVLDCVLEMAALDLAQDDHRDPIEPPRAQSAAARAVFGYHMTHERRFVCSKALRAPLTAWCRDQGARCVVRATRR